MHCGGFSCSGMGATNLNYKGPTDFTIIDSYINASPMHANKMTIRNVF